MGSLEVQRIQCGRDAFGIAFCNSTLQALKTDKDVYIASYTQRHIYSHTNTDTHTHRETYTHTHTHEDT